MYNCPVRWYTVVDEMSVDEMSRRSVVDEMFVDELSWNPAGGSLNPVSDYPGVV